MEMKMMMMRTFMVFGEGELGESDMDFEDVDVL